MRLEQDGLEIVYMQNDFWGPATTSATREVRIGVIVAAQHKDTTNPNKHTCIIAEIQIILQQYHRMKWHFDFFQEMEEGAYTDANMAMRQTLGERVKEEEATMADKDQVEPNIEVTPEMALTKSSLGSFRRLFAVVATRAAVHNVPMNVWWWATWPDVIEQDFCKCPVGADILKIDTERKSIVTASSETWVQVTSMEDSAELPIDAVLSVEERSMNRERLLELLVGEHNIIMEQKDIDRLVGELFNGDIRLFRSPRGALCRVVDHVILRVWSPQKLYLLVKFSRPCGIPTIERRSHESVSVAARRVIASQIPSFLQSQLDVNDFNIEDGAWIIPDCGEGGQEKVQQKTLPLARRYFVMQAHFVQEPDPFLLARAALGIDL